MLQFIKFYFTSSMLNMFRTLIHPSLGACEFFVVSPHWFVCSCFDVCWSFGVAVWGGTRVTGWSSIPRFSLPHGYHPNQPHRNSNTHRNKNTQPMWWYNKKSRRLLMMDVLMSETCWTKRSEIKLNKSWHQVGLLFFNYHNDARSNMHKIKFVVKGCLD